ncbi:copper transport protein ctr4 [Xylariomycetidae sp. FL2044]|nr:copper transport protein ctr4 [Xylariomycetidae sp. FL2044]
MDHMSMDMSSDSACKMTMLWNWDTIDACFLAESWRIRNDGMLAASCIGAVLLVICLEFLRRVGKEYDLFILRQFQQHMLAQATMAKSGDGCCSDSPAPGSQILTFRATPLQQFIRSAIHAVSFGLAYIIMLIVMSFNGYIIISIIIGAGLGKFLCDWMIQKVVINFPVNAVANAGPVGIEEPSVCCG